MDNLHERIDRYFQAISLCANFDEAVEATSRFLERPVLVIDTAMNHLSHYPLRKTGDGDWDSVLETGHVPYEYASVTRANNAIPMPDGMLHRCIYSPANDTEMEKYRCRLSSGALHLGGMMVLADGVPFTEQDLIPLQLAAQTLSASLHSHARPEYEVTRSRRQILSELLSRDPHDVMDDMRTGYPALYALEGQRMVVGYTDPKPGDYDLAPFWQRTLNASLPDAQVIQHKGSLLFFFPMGTATENAFVSALRAQLGHIHMQIGLSDPFTSFLDFRAQAENAKLAYRLGCRTQPDEPLCTVSAYRLQMMASILGSSETVHSLCHPAAQQLMQHDAANGTHYCAILHAYLFCFHNYSLAAKALFMHRNTLTYHLERIEALLGVDLDDPKTCQELLWSLTLLEEKA